MIWSFHIGRECGALREKTIQRTIPCPPETVCRGIDDVLKQWAAHASIGECLTLSVRRER